MPLTQCLELAHAFSTSRCGYHAVIYLVYLENFTVHQVSKVNITWNILERFPIHKRWLSEYNLPDCGIASKPLPQPRVSRLETLIGQIITKVRRIGSTSNAESALRSLNYHVDNLIKETDEMLEWTPTPQHQPRWGCTNSHKEPCGKCATDTCETDLRCAYHRIRYHQRCLVDSSCPECGSLLSSCSEGSVKTVLIPLFS